MKNKTVLYIVGGVMILLLFLIGAYKLTNTGSPSSYGDITTVKANDHVKWSPDKKNVLVEYSDFQCPACKAYHDILKPFEASSSPDFKITQKVAFIYRFFPLYQVHQNAYAASYAAEAAGKQRKFFELGDLLFDTQDQWKNLGNPSDFFVKLAEQLKLDTEKFKSDMNASDVKKRVDDDLASGNNAGVNSTPTFFLNGKKLDTIRSFDEFKKLLSSL